MRRLSAVMTGDVDARLRAHLLRADGQEDLCFVVYHPSTGATRRTAVIFDVVLPTQGDRNVHGNASFQARYFLRALATAEEAGAGLALAHSHPGGRGWQDMSPDDIDAERGHAGQAWAATGLPLFGLTLASDGSWSGRSWERTGRHMYVRDDCERVRVVDDQLRITYHPRLAPPPTLDRRMARTVSAWGERAQADLSRLHVGVVGAGSVGILVAEALVRTGIRELTLIDFDSVRTHNLDRLAHATRLDAALARPKVDVARDAVLRSAPIDEVVVHAIDDTVVHDAGFRAALDCDVVFSCVDRPWARQLLDYVAFAHLIPVVDGGISVGAVPSFSRADWKVQIASPPRRCLECAGQYLPADVALERAGDLDDPSYIEGLPPDHRLRAGENVYAFSSALASLEVLQFLSMVLSPVGFADVGEWNFHFVSGRMDVTAGAQCAEHCAHLPIIGAGDSAAAPTGTHRAAGDEAARRARVRSHVATRVGERARQLLSRCSTYACTRGADFLERLDPR
jgi:molybdopterin-synthase adenylyltransferase